MTAKEAERILLEVMDAHIDARCAAQGKVHTERQREAGRNAMLAFLRSKGVDFEKIGAAMSPEDLRRGAEAVEIPLWWPIHDALYVYGRFRPEVHER